MISHDLKLQPLENRRLGRWASDVRPLSQLAVFPGVSNQLEAEYKTTLDGRCHFCNMDFSGRLAGTVIDIDD